MEGNLWSAIQDSPLLIAVVEFVILIIIVVWWVQPKRSVVSQVVEKRGKRTGIIKKLRFGVKGIGRLPVTVFEIHEPGGNIFLAGLDGHENALSEGDLIEFWPTSKSVANTDIPGRRQASDGTIFAWTENIRYYGLKRYRVLPADKTPAEEAPAESELPTETGD